MNLIEDAFEKDGPPPSPRTFAANTEASLPRGIPKNPKYLTVRIYTAVSSKTAESIYDLMLNYDICADETWEDALVVAAPGSDERLFWGRARDNDTHFFYAFSYLFAHLGVQLPNHAQRLGVY